MALGGFAFFLPSEVTFGAHLTTFTTPTPVILSTNFENEFNV